jgi:hypothetical protein
LEIGGRQDAFVEEAAGVQQGAGVGEGQEALGPPPLWVEGQREVRRWWSEGALGLSADYEQPSPTWICSRGNNDDEGRATPGKVEGTTVTVCV